MVKNYRVYVTNIDASINVLRALGISASSNGTGVAFSVLESQKMDIILALNKAKIVVYDLEEI